MTSDRDLQTEATDWVVRLDAGTARADDFARWRDADPRRRIAFVQALAAWEAMSQARAVEETATPAVGRAGSRWDRRAFLKAAGVVGPVLALGGGGALLLRDDRAHAATVVGEMRRFEATQGLTIELNTDSRIAWKARGRSCDVWLEKGEAALFIDGAALTGVTLKLAEGEILLTPGAYATRLVDDAPEVLVIDGGARLADAGLAPPTAHTGQKIKLAHGRPVQLEAAKDVAAATAWRRGEIVFFGQTLGEAVVEYNRYLDHKLVVADPAVAAIRIGGRFDTVRPGPFLAALEQSFDLDTRSTDGGIVIERKSATR